MDDITENFVTECLIKSKYKPFLNQCVEKSQLNVLLKFTKKNTYGV